VQTGKGVRMVTLATCARCQGRGQRIESPCETCRGNGYEFKPHTLKVQIPPGVDDGMVVRLSGQGEPNANGGPPGDLMIRPHIRPHASFQRQGDDLYTVVPITFPDAALGTKVPLTAIGGETIRLTVPAGTQGGTTLRIPGKGMRRLDGKGKGDLMVIVEVRTPTDLTSRQRKLLEEFAKLEAQRSKPIPGSERSGSMWK
jgi:molecular chaperone DnaJ